MPPSPCGNNTLYSYAGSWACTAVSPGYYSIGGTNTTRIGQQICPPGTMCQAGVQTSCVNGSTYSSTNGSQSCFACSTSCATGLVLTRNCTLTSNIQCDGECLVQCSVFRVVCFSFFVCFCFVLFFVFVCLFVCLLAYLCDYLLICLFV